MASRASSATWPAEYGDAIVPTQVSEKIVVFPRENSGVVELKKYFDNAKKVITDKGWNSLVRGKTPSAHAHLQPVDLTAFPELVAGTDVTAAMVNNRADKRAQIQHDNNVKATRLAAAEQEMKEAFATWIEDSMRPHAGLRLSRLMDKHVKEKGTDGEWHDGVAMWKELLALARADISPEDADDHKEKLDKILNDKLADGCHVQDLAEKVNVIQRDVNPYLAMKYEGANLSRLFLKLMPDNLAMPKLMLTREIETASKMDDPDHVLQQIERVIRGAQRSGVEPVQMVSGVCVQVPSPSNPTVTGENKKKTKKEREASARKAVPGMCKMLDNLRMPDGKTCKAGTCKFDHDKTKPGAPCFCDPRVGGGYLPKSLSDVRLARINQDRAANAKRLGVPCKPAWRDGENGKEKREHAAAAVCSYDDDGLWGDGAPQFVVADPHLDAGLARAYTDSDIYETDDESDITSDVEIAEVTPSRKGTLGDVPHGVADKQATIPLGLAVPTRKTWFTVIGGAHEGVHDVDDAAEARRAFSDMVHAVGEPRVRDHGVGDKGKADAWAFYARHVQAAPVAAVAAKRSYGAAFLGLAAVLAIVALAALCGWMLPGAGSVSVLLGATVPTIGVSEAAAAFVGPPAPPCWSFGAFVLHSPALFSMFAVIVLGILHHVASLEFVSALACAFVRASCGAGRRLLNFCRQHGGVVFRNVFVFAL